MFEYIVFFFLKREIEIWRPGQSKVLLKLRMNLYFHNPEKTIFFHEITQSRETSEKIKFRIPFLFCLIIFKETLFWNVQSALPAYAASNDKIDQSFNLLFDVDARKRQLCTKLKYQHEIISFYFLLDTVLIWPGTLIMFQIFCSAAWLFCIAFIKLNWTFIRTSALIAWLFHTALVFGKKEFSHQR